MKRLGIFILSGLLVAHLQIATLFWPQPAEARPGGGHSSSSHSASRRSSPGRSSYSWSRSSSRSASWPSSSGNSVYYGGSSAEMLFWTLAIIVLVVVLITMANAHNAAQTRTSSSRRVVKSNQDSETNRALRVLQQQDPNFSKILLMDFVHLLFSKLYHYAGRAELSYLTPFLSADVQQYAAFILGQPAQEVVINGIHWEAISQTTQQDSITLTIDANYSLNKHGVNCRYAVTERWLLCRKNGLLSPEPEKMQALSCPQCAAPAHFNDAGECPYCKTVLSKGAMQWYLHKRIITLATQLDASEPASYAQEEGTQLPTIQQFDLHWQITAMQHLHRFEQWDSYFADFQTQVVRPFFFSIYQHWSRGDWEGVRHLLSDRLYEANQFWMDYYRQHNWFNRLDKLNIERIALARLEVDSFYEAITVRIFANCYDYTEDSKGILVGGSKRHLRHYSEYWTFVRRIGVHDKQTGIDLNQCPQCGAPADKMGQAAKCGYCGSKISTGKFSWVLFLIMQDDVYRG